MYSCFSSAKERLLICVDVTWVLLAVALMWIGVVKIFTRKAGSTMLGSSLMAACTDMSSEDVSGLMSMVQYH